MSIIIFQLDIYYKTLFNNKKFIQNQTKLNNILENRYTDIIIYNIIIKLHILTLLASTSNRIILVLIKMTYCVNL